MHWKIVISWETAAGDYMRIKNISLQFLFFLKWLICAPTHYTSFVLAGLFEADLSIMDTHNPPSATTTLTVSVWLTAVCFCLHATLPVSMETFTLLLFCCLSIVRLYWNSAGPCDYRALKSVVTLMWTAGGYPKWCSRFSRLRLLARHLTFSLRTICVPMIGNAAISRSLCTTWPQLQSTQA